MKSKQGSAAVAERPVESASFAVVKRAVAKQFAEMNRTSTVLYRVDLSGGQFSNGTIESQGSLSPEQRRATTGDALWKARAPIEFKRSDRRLIRNSTIPTDTIKRRTTMNNFERASRLKLRFDTAKGVLDTEDLWDIPLIARNGGVSLDAIAREMARDLKDADVENFVVKTSKAESSLQLKFDLVKHVIDVRLAENEAAKTRAENREKKDKILEILASKRAKGLEEKTEEELLAMVEAL